MIYVSVSRDAINKTQSYWGHVLGTQFLTCQIMSTPHHTRTSVPSQSARHSFQLAISISYVKNAEVSADLACRRSRNGRRLMKVHPPHQLQVQVVPALRTLSTLAIQNWHTLKAMWVKSHLGFKKGSYRKSLPFCISHMIQPASHASNLKLCFWYFPLSFLKNCISFL